MANVFVAISQIFCSIWPKFFFPWLCQFGHSKLSKHSFVRIFWRISKYLVVQAFSPHCFGQRSILCVKIVVSQRFCSIWPKLLDFKVLYFEYLWSFNTDLCCYELRGNCWKKEKDDINSDGSIFCVWIGYFRLKKLYLHTQFNNWCWVVSWVVLGLDWHQICYRSVTASLCPARGS